MRISLRISRHVAALLPGLMACLALGGCASELKKAEAQLVELGDLLPGHYNNVAQSQEDAKAGREPHAAQTLDIVRLQLPLLSDYAFYAQEAAADDARRITSQRLYTFVAVKDGSVVQTVYSFSQPGRWRDGHLNPGLFRGMMFEDTKPLGGCDLVWKKEGDKFVGQNSRDTCRVTSAGLGSVRMEMKAELSADELATAELAYGAGGKLVQGNSADPFYRYQRGE
jgi:hypothetical protein